MTTKAKEKTEPAVTTGDVGALTGAPTAAPAEPAKAAESVPDEHKADVERLAQVEAEAQQLREKLADAGVAVAFKPHEPSFGLCEGTREELQRTGKAVDPFTGKKLTRDDLARIEVEVDVE